MKNLFLFLLLHSFVAKAQTVKVLTSGNKSSLRGLSVVDDNVIWASGSNGTIVKSVDGGETWQWLTVNGFEKTDFRDVEAFDSSTAVIMGIAEPSYILKTVDGGNTWKVVYENKIKGMFLDAMDFRDKQNGIVIGDPLKNEFFIAQSSNGGNTWKDANNTYWVADSGEACFASSGTNIRLSPKDKIHFVSGGLRSRLFTKNKAIDIPILQGKETTGANSIAIKNKRTYIVTGGDFNTPGSSLKNCAITYNKGKTWTQPVVAPHGYRSCVEYINKNYWITCGLNGVDISNNNGRTWQLISEKSFHVCRKAKNGKAIYFAGANGKIGKLQRL